MEAATAFLRRFVAPLSINPVMPAQPAVNQTSIGGQSVVVNVRDNTQAAIVGAQLANNRRAQLRMAAFGSMN